MRFADLTTMRVGGEVGTLLRPTSRTDLVSAALATWAEDDPWLVLGGGSNVVAAEARFEGTVIRVESRGITAAASAADPNTVTLDIEAGEPWDAVVDYAVAAGLCGIEAMAGIPGSTGAAPVQNIGAYGQELSDVLASVDFLDYGSGEVARLAADELALGYRTSALKRGRRGVVLAVQLELEVSATDTVEYEQLAAAIDGIPGGSDEKFALARIRDAVLGLRRSKGMVLDAADPDSVSCGSFFTNPIVSATFARQLPAALPRWPVGDETVVKLSAAWLIERAGIRRGFRLAGSRAAISDKHTLAITNRGNAAAEEVAELARFIGERVRSELGVSLQPEPVGVGLEL